MYNPITRAIEEELVPALRKLLNLFLYITFTDGYVQENTASGWWSTTRWLEGIWPEKSRLRQFQASKHEFKFS